jgi:hypothetical protein
VAPRGTSPQTTTVSELLKVDFYDRPVRIAIVPPGAPLQALGASALDELVTRRISCTLSDTTEANDFLAETRILFLIEVGDDGARELDRVVKAWLPVLFTSSSSAPLADLDFAVVTVGTRRPYRAWNRAVSNVRSVLTYYGAREVCPHRHAFGRTPRDFGDWIAGFLSLLRPDCIPETASAPAP